MTEFDIRELLDGFMDEGIEIREKEVVSLTKVKEDVMNRIDKPVKRRTRRMMGALLAAVICVAALAVTALAVEMLRLDQRRGEVIQYTECPEPTGTVENTQAPETDNGIVYTAVNIVGAYGSPEYKAAQEWSDWLASAEEDGRNEMFPKGFENMTPEEIEERHLELDEKGIYSDMSAFSDEACEALDAIVEKHGLRLSEYFKSITWQELFDMANEPNLLPISTFLSNTVNYWEGGALSLVSRATLENGKTVNYDVNRSAKGVFSGSTGLMAETNITEEWEYTTAGGTTVTLDLGANKSAIMADMENGFVYVNVRSGTENTDTMRDGLGPDTLTREDLEELADAINFTALDRIK